MVQSVFIGIIVAGLLAGVRSSQPAICEWEETGVRAEGYGWRGFCSPSATYLAAQTGSSIQARLLVAYAKGDLACRKHNLSGKKPNFAACANDKANGCYVAGRPGAWSCNTWYPFWIAKLKFTCPGTPYANYITCNAKSKNSCSGPCTWRRYLTKAEKKTESNYQKATGNLYKATGFCYPSVPAAKWTRAQDMARWYRSLFPDPSNAKLYEATQGTCKYALEAKQRIAYMNKCQAVNHPSTGLMVGNKDKKSTLLFSTLNGTAAANCYKAGCVLMNVPGKATLGLGEGNDYFECGPDPPIRYNLRLLNTKDVGVASSIGTCSALPVRYNKQLCLAARASAASSPPALGKQSVPVCAWDPTGDLADGSSYSSQCAPSPAYMAAQTGTIFRSKYIVAVQKAQLACGQYKLGANPTPAQFQACAQDRENGCYVEGEVGGWYCTQYNAVTRYKTQELQCPGTPNELYIKCQSTYKDRCTGECSWILDLFFPSEKDKQDLKTFLNVTGGLYNLVGYCFPTYLTKTWKTYADFDAWTAPEVSSNYTAYKEYFGTCYAAVESIKRVTYANACKVYSDPNRTDFGLMTGSFSQATDYNITGMNSTAATRCVASGCTLALIPNLKGFKYEFGNHDYFYCATDVTVRYALGLLGPKDKGLAIGVGTCGADSLRFNKDLCLSAKLQPK